MLSDNALHESTRTQHCAGRAPSSPIAIELSSCSVHCVVHCLIYYSSTLFMGTVHGHCTREVSESGFQSGGA